MEEKKSKKADLERRKGLFFQIGLVIVLAIVLWAFNYKSYDKKEYAELTKDAEEVIEDIVIQTQTEDLPPPPPEQQQQQQSEELEITETIKPGEEHKIETGPATNIAPPPPPPPPKEEKEEKEDEIFVVAEEQPEFPGGDEALLKYLADNIKYPEYAKQNNMQGRVFIDFVVEKDGSISNVKIKRDIPGSGCGVEAVRVVKGMPKWKPGKQRGKAVRVSYTLPVNFRLR